MNLCQNVWGQVWGYESTKGDCSTIFESIDLAKQHGFPITLHIGEQPSENPEQQMKELSRIEPQRLGHAVHLCPQAQQWVNEKRPVIEACIKSALNCSSSIKVGKMSKTLKNERRSNSKLYLMVKANCR